MDIVESILCKLPVKSLMRFRCVHKSWNSLISDPKFARSHLGEFNRHNLLVKFNKLSPNNLLLKSYPLPSSASNAVSVIPPPLEHPPLNRFDWIVGSCDGIICISLCFADTFLLWNPSIRTFIESPPLEETHLEGDDIVHSFGFGYDHLTETYKVVAVFFEENELESEIMVHTVGTDYWRRIEEEFPGLPEDNSGKFVSGTINWITFANAMWYVIVSFDLGKESCHQLCLPAELEDGFILGALRDCLCVFSENDMFCDIWVMKEHGNEESWAKLFSISHDLGRNRPLYISEDDDEILLPSFSNLVVCNYEYICDMVFKIFDIQNSRVWMLPKILDEPEEPEVYAESLISPCPLY